MALKTLQQGGRENIEVFFITNFSYLAKEKGSIVELE